jgi:predicted component of type VI protein secretion system
VSGQPPKTWLSFVHSSSPLWSFFWPILQHRIFPLVVEAKADHRQAFRVNRVEAVHPNSQLDHQLMTMTMMTTRKTMMMTIMIHANGTLVHEHSPYVCH